MYTFSSIVFPHASSHISSLLDKRENKFAKNCMSHLAIYVTHHRSFYNVQIAVGIE